MLYGWKNLDIDLCLAEIINSMTRNNIDSEFFVYNVINQIERWLFDRLTDSDAVYKPKNYLKDADKTIKVCDAECVKEKIVSKANLDMETYNKVRPIFNRVKSEREKQAKLEYFDQLFIDNKVNANTCDYFDMQRKTQIEDNSNSNNMINTSSTESKKNDDTSTDNNINGNNNTLMTKRDKKQNMSVDINEELKDKVLDVTKPNILDSNNLTHKPETILDVTNIDMSRNIITQSIIKKSSKHNSKLPFKKTLY